jgi:hypothetical protein
MTKIEKTKEERLSEGISLLKQMKEHLDPEEGAFLEMKRVITQWINDGKAWDGRIEVPSYGRYIELALPKSATVAATLAFKVKK